MMVLVAVAVAVARYLALDDEVRPGFSSLSYTVHVDSDATPEQLEEIRLAAERSSPMFDNAKNATPVAGQIETA